MRDRPNDNHRAISQPAPGEVVHHKDEDKSNNSKANLENMSVSKHNSITAKSRGSKLSRLRTSLRMVNERKKLY